MDDEKFIGKCNWCGKENVELDLDFGGCITCAEKYAKEQKKQETGKC